MISLVIPIHNEEDNIEPLYRETKAVLDTLGKAYEIVYVNDGSTDGSGEILAHLKAEDPHVRVVNMDRNRGEAAALTAGFHFARGETIVTMDGDGQNNPAYIPMLVEKLEEGPRAVSGWRRKREEPFFTRVLPSIVANRLIALVTGLKVHDNGCSLKAYKADVVKGIQIPHGFHRFIPAIFGVKGKEVAEIEIKDRPRISGRTHYGLSRTIEVLRELVTIPFALRGPEGWISCLRLLFYCSLAIFIFYLLFCFLVPRALYFLPVPIFVILLTHVAFKNLNRFLKAQKEGVFQAKEFDLRTPMT